MDLQTLLIYVVAIGFILAIYKAYQVKGRIHCVWTRRDKTVTGKWVKAERGERINFENGWYYVRYDKVKLEVVDSGFNIFLPTMARRLDFIAGIGEPIDPQTGLATVLTAEARKALDTKEDIINMDAGTNKVFGKLQKAGGLSSWTPIIMIIAVVIIGWFLWQLNGKIDMVGNATNVLQQMIDKIGK